MTLKQQPRNWWGCLVSVLVALVLVLVVLVLAFEIAGQRDAAVQAFWELNDITTQALALAAPPTQVPQVNAVEPEPLMPVYSGSSSQDPAGSQSYSGGVPGFEISGAPGTAGNVLVVQCPDAFGNCFENSIGLGSQMMLAEPGSVLVGPDFQDHQMVAREPSIDWISPITQFTLSAPQEDANAAEGAFLWFTGATVTAEVRDFTVRLEGSRGHNWFLMIRGLFPDGKQDADRNSTVAFSDYVAGHAQVMLYPTGAFISEGNFLQVAELSHRDARNCGNEGCSGLSVFMLDLNTGAWLVLHQPQVNAPWEFVDSNQ